MSKYSVGAVEVVDDDHMIDWSKITGAPSAATVASAGIGTITNCSAYMGLNVSQSTDANGVVTFTFTAVELASVSNCNCACSGAVNCNC